MVALSVLDTAPVWQGSTPAQSLRDMMELARGVERLGYRRYWVAEHHNTLSIASSSPPVLVGQLAAVTSTLRVGAGGVMLPNHPPLVVAEQFGTLEALHPGRIDLGIGRAPGTDPLTARALRRTAGQLSDEDFPAQIAELAGYFDGPNTSADGHPIHAIPAAGNRPALWLLGSSESSGELAGRLGLPYAFAHHIRPDNLDAALDAYRRAFRPSAALPDPYVMVATLVIAADTQEHAEWLSSSLGMAIVRLTREGFSHGPHLPPAQAAAHPFSDEDRALIRQHMSVRVVGGPDTVRRQVTDLLERTAADELMVITLIQDREDRFRSYELLAEAVAVTAG